MLNEEHGAGTFAELRKPLETWRNFAKVSGTIAYFTDTEIVLPSCLIAKSCSEPSGGSLRSENARIESGLVRLLA